MFFESAATRYICQEESSPAVNRTRHVGCVTRSAPLGNALTSNIPYRPRLEFYIAESWFRHRWKPRDKFSPNNQRPLCLAPTLQISEQMYCERTTLSNRSTIFAPAWCNHTIVNESGTKKKNHGNKSRRLFTFDVYWNKAIRNVNKLDSCRAGPAPSKARLPNQYAWPPQLTSLLFWKQRLLCLISNFGPPKSTALAPSDAENTQQCICIHVFSCI